MTLVRTGDFPRQNAVVARFMRLSVVRESDRPPRFSKLYFGNGFSPLIRAAVASGRNVHRNLTCPARGLSTLDPRLRTPRSPSVKQPPFPRYMNLMRPVVSGGPIAEFTALALIFHFHTSRIPGARDPTPRHAAHPKPLVAMAGKRSRASGSQSLMRCSMPTPALTSHH